MTQSIDDRWITMVPGIRRRTLAAGEHMMQMVVTLDAGSHLPGGAVTRMLQSSVAHYG